MSTAHRVELLLGAVLIAGPGLSISRAAYQAPAPAPNSAHVQPNPPETVYTPGHDGVSYPRIRYSVGPDVRPSTPLPPGNGNGSCVLDLIVDANGVPQQVKVLRSLSPDLDPLAVKAASQWRFFPAELHGKPVAVRIQLQIQFHKR